MTISSQKFLGKTYENLSKKTYETLRAVLEKT